MTTAALTILPPLRQSSAELLGCEYSYALQFIAGLKPPSTPPAVRGTEIHEAMAAYAQHCAAKRIDWPGYNGDGTWYAPEDEGDPVYAEDVDAPAPPLWASLLALIPGDRESRILALFVATVGCLLIAAILLTAHFAQKAGPPW
jgi:hypothetical protein